MSLRTDPALLREEIKATANDHGLAVASVTTGDDFPGLEERLVEHIERGHTDGMDWFSAQRAAVSASPRALHPTIRSIVSVGIPYYRADIDPPRDGVKRGRIARYAWGVDYHDTLKQRMRSLLAAIEQRVGRKLEARVLVDTARIVDRAVAQRSGLGWFGKHSNIIVPNHSSFVMLGELLLDLEIAPDEPLRKDCGRCTICLDRCPTNAIVAPYTVHSPRCISFQTIEQRGPIPAPLRPLFGDWVFGCDVCQEVCPYTGAARSVYDAAFEPQSLDNAFPSLAWLLAMSDAEFRATYRGSAVMRAKRRGLARNAAIALGNVGDLDDIPMLADALGRHDEPMVRGHAAWALARIGGDRARAAVSDAARNDQDAMVRDEADAALWETHAVAQQGPMITMRVAQ